LNYNLREMEMNLKMYLQHHYGSLTACAEAIEVSRSTLHNYVTKDPEGVLRHTSRLMKNENIKPQDLIKAVLTTQNQYV
jgi:ApbE superfamily uncharacterized protein (UPF0280 family)